jgi:ubiquinone/menaquinone biosynthesis C-methylase UbiE
MSREDHIYLHEADRYEELVSHEDVDKRVLPAIESVVSLTGKDVVEVGAGTGRLTLQLAPQVRSLTIFDRSVAMLEVAEKRLREAGFSNWKMAPASNHSLPSEENVADVVISGWSVCYAYADNPGTEKESLARVLTELQRVLRPGGTIILLENMGTGSESPNPPPHLLPYFQDLFQFDSPQHADKLSRFFFGDELADKIIEKGWSRVPECTGMWWVETGEDPLARQAGIKRSG